MTTSASVLPAPTEPPGGLESPPSALEGIFDRFGDDLRGFLRARVGDAATADDLLQTVWLRVHQRLPSLRDHERLEAWLYQIARNAVVDHFRRQRPHDELPPDLVAEPGEPERPDLGPALARFLDALPAEDREALRLTEYEGLTQRELAARLGISVSGAKSRVQRARARLRAQLEACCRFEFDRRGNLIGAVPHHGGDRDCACT
jgi:RNA polymerase sigma-70 factor (ECF subfamily)